jgi:uncharacterized membrane protein YfcA
MSKILTFLRSALAAPRTVTLLVTGLAAGFASGLLGIGGGLIAVPVLISAFGLPVKAAVGTSLPSVFVAAAVGVGVEIAIASNHVDWFAAALLSLGTVVGSRLGRPLLRVAPERTLRVAFVAYLGIAALRSLGGTAVPEHVHVSPSAPLTVLVGAAAGLSSVLLGVGGGVVTVPALAVLGGGMSFHAARATSLVMIAVSAGLGALQHRALGTTDVSLAGRLLPGVAAGAMLGAWLANLLPAGPCRLIFGAFLVVAAARMAWPARWRFRVRPRAPEAATHPPAAEAARKAAALVAFAVALLASPALAREPSLTFDHGLVSARFDGSSQRRGPCG